MIFLVGRILLCFSFDISMTNSDSFFDLMDAGFLPVSLVKFFSIAHGLKFLFLSGFILHPKFEEFEIGFDLGDSSSPAKI